MKNINLVLLIVFLLTSQLQGQDDFIIAWDNEDFTCSQTQTQYFDWGQGECLFCDDNFVTQPDGYSCGCDTGDDLRKISPYDYFRCLNIQPGTQDCPQLDLYYHIGFLANAEDKCIPGPTGLTLEDDTVLYWEQNGNIKNPPVKVDCSANSQPNEDKTRCIPCPDPLMTYTAEDGCTCTDDYLNSIDKCILKSDLPQAFQESVFLTQVNALSSGTYQSDYFQKYVYKSLNGCLNYSDPQSCNTLANMCVFKLYQSDEAGSDICDALKLGSTVNTSDPNYTELNPYYNNSPWIYYVDNVEEITKNDAIKSRMLIREPEEESETEMHIMQYYIAVYNIYGEQTDFRELGTEFILCPNSILDAKLQKKFGNDYSNSCQMNLSKYLINYTTELYELFLYDIVSDKYIEIPVRFTDGDADVLASEDNTASLTEADSTAETGTAAAGTDTATTDEETEVTGPFYRRFFIIDNVTSRTDINDPQTVKTFRFAKEIYFKTSLQEEDEYIYVPTVHIIYAYQDVTTENNEIVLPVLLSNIFYQSEYFYDPVNFWVNANILFVFFQIFIFIVWVIKTLVFIKINPDNNPTQSYTAYVALNSVCIGMDTWANGTFYMLLLLTGYWFFFFKFQIRSYVLLPSQTEPDYGENYYYFDVLFWVMYGFKTASMIYFVYKQSSYEIFFIDWETTKEKQIQKKQNNLQYNYNNMNNQQGNLGDNIQAQNNYNQQKNATGLDLQDPGISVWRNLFVANEFNELQVERTVEIEWALFFLAFFLVGLEMENLAYEIPGWNTDESDIQKVEYNHVLKFFISGFVFLFIGLFMLTMRRILMLKWPLQIQDFNDLCSVANISIIIFDSELHGYYLHGKAPIGISEGNSLWLDTALKKEGKAKAKRGLVKGQDLQCFEFIVSQQFKNNYNGQFKQKLDKMQFEQNQIANNYINKATPVYEKSKFEELEQSKTNLQNHLKQQLQDIEANHSNHVKDKTIWTRLFGWPEIEPEKVQSLPMFYKDPEYSIQKVLYIGNELHLLQYDIITYCMWDIVLENTLLAIVLTYIFDKMFEYIRSEMGKRNIAKKSLIDEMFLN